MNWRHTKEKWKRSPKKCSVKGNLQKKNKVDGKELRKAKKEKKDLLDSLNKPKRPLSSYILYTMDRRPQLPSDMSSTDKVKKMGMEWKEANKPKRPLSSYILYTMDRRPQLPS